MNDNWQEGNPYERYVGRWSRRLAPRFLAWLALPRGLAWLDVGCGTGALAGAILDRCEPARVYGVEPSEGFRRTAGEALGSRVSLLAGDAASIPLEAGSVDVAVSALVLNFVPDPRAALAEMARVARAGGTIAGYVWDYAGKMELMRAFWDAAVELDPAARERDEGIRFPLCRPEALRELLEAAGLERIATEGLEVETRFRDFDDYWSPFLGGQGPAPAYAMSLDEAHRARLRDRLREKLAAQSDGSILLVARAWAFRGVKR